MNTLLSMQTFLFTVLLNNINTKIKEILHSVLDPDVNLIILLL